MPSGRSNPPRAEGAPDDREQAARRSQDEQLAARIAGLDLTDRLRSAGRPWPEANPDGHVVMRDAGHATCDEDAAAALRADDAVGELAGTMDETVYPPDYLAREREGWRE